MAPVRPQRILQGPGLEGLSFQPDSDANLCVLELALEAVQGLLELSVLVGLLGEFAGGLDERVEIALDHADLVDALNEI